MKSPFRSPSNTLNFFGTRMNFVVIKLKTIQHVNGFYFGCLEEIIWILSACTTNCQPTHALNQFDLYHTSYLASFGCAGRHTSECNHTLLASDAYLWWFKVQEKQVGKQVKCNVNGIFSFYTTTRSEHQTAIISSPII